LLQGEATLLFEDESSIKMASGDYLMIPAHRKHRVTFTSTHPPAIWLAIFITTSHHDQ
jgi:cupin 2 domain-containing protein